MQQQTKFSPQALREALESLLVNQGDAQISLEELQSRLLPALTAQSEVGPEVDLASEATHTDAFEEIDLGAMVSGVLEDSLGGQHAASAEASGNPSVNPSGGGSGPGEGPVAISLFHDVPVVTPRGEGPSLTAQVPSVHGGNPGSDDQGRPSVSGRSPSSPAQSSASARGPQTPVPNAAAQSHPSLSKPAQIFATGGGSSLSTPAPGGSLFPSPNPDVAPADDFVPERWGRYRIDGELARGGQGRILGAFDDMVGRPVALKILRKDGMKDARLVRRFYEEAQVTGQLEHPNIVPVHELGWLDNGLPYYTMKKVVGRTLKKVILQLRKGAPQVKEQYGRIKLLNILVQVCQAVAFGHDHGVIHRDLKPANIMLGDYGEVIVLDWGVARVVGVKDPQPDGPRPVKLMRLGGTQDTLAGTVEGTPAYMAPEQARGRINEIDARTDIYALGAILYELLTFRPPFRGQDVREVLRQVVEVMPERPQVVAPQNQIPDELEMSCMKCLAKDPADRYPKVRDFQADLESYLEGTKRRQAAQVKVTEAQGLVRQHQELQRELLLARMVARRAGEGIEGWEPIERKRGVWATRAKVQEVEAQVYTTFGEAVARFSQALAHEPENAEAREGLADLFYAQLKKAEAQSDYSQVVYCESMIRQYHGTKYAAFLKGDGFLTLETEPVNAEVWLYRYEERDRVLRPVDPRRLGVTPVTELRLPRGSYLLVLRAPGLRDVYYPIRLNRQESWKARVRLYTHAQIGDGLVYIPGGPTLLGGDREAIDAFEQEIKNVGDFAIQEFPVTFREYIEFLNAWAAVDMQEANRLLPMLDVGVPLVSLGPQGFVPVRELICPEGRALGQPGMEYDVAVFGVDYEAAEAYCAWRTEISGRVFRLPTEEEWEKAARGVDGRAFPWGHQFDPTFCKSRQSRPWAPEPEPIASFPEDTSPYGVRDMAGGVREWTDGWFNESQNQRVLRGGAWVDGERYTRCATRSHFDPNVSKRLAGFRFAANLP